MIAHCFLESSLKAYALIAGGKLSGGFGRDLLGAGGATGYHDDGGWSEDQRPGASVNQTDLQQMAEERIKDAKALIDAGRWEFAYYAAGYAVECALKSCVLARMIYTGCVFDEDVKKLDDCRTHDFLMLIQIAGLRDEHNANLKASAAAGGEFVTNWDTVKLWKVTSRDDPKTEADAKRLYAAIIDQPHGVLKWIRNYW